MDQAPGINTSSMASPFSFDLTGQKNRLIEIFSPVADACQGSAYSPVGLIGKFAGREEATYQILNPSGLFAFVIAGEFEVQYRLLQAGDGLALWGLQQVELEALSNDAIILLVEVPVAA